MREARVTEKKTASPKRSVGRPTRRIIVIAVCLLAMIPAALAYAGGGLLSGFPSSATVGDSVTWKVDPGDEEGDLKVTASGASVSVNGYSFTVTFNQAGTATIKASIGGTSDSCSVKVSEKEDPEDDPGDDPEDDPGDDPGTDDPGSDDPGNTPGGKKPGGSMPSGMKAPSGSGAGSVSGSAASTESKTVYKGSADNYLESLSVEGYEFTQAFHKTNDTYFMTLEAGEDYVTVNAEPSDSDADVVITGTDELSTGRNKVMVSVTAENGSVRVYRIYIDVK